jgi:hypothetical protein
MSPPYGGEKVTVDVWQPLVHVCRRWRNLVFRSLRRLNLRLVCTPLTPARDTLDIWPALPLIIKQFWSSPFSSSTDNIIAALGQSNRVYAILLNLADWQLEQVLAAIQVPFLELTDLRLYSSGETPSVIPDSFLGGSAPRLQTFESRGIPLPGLLKLHLSATHLVTLRLYDNPL